MKSHIFLTFIAAALLLASPAGAQERKPDAPGAKWEGLADTPQMGWSSWNKFETDINEDLIKDIKFPSGMKALADYLHSKGIKLGIYSDAGTNTCACYAGSLGHEYQDAFMYAYWGVDYLKYDWCYTNDINPKGAYALMRNALRAAGRPIFFSMCEWGSSKPWEWAAEVGHSWRTTGDIGVGFLPIPQRYDENGNKMWTPLGVMPIVDLNEPLRKYAGPGHWNDPDMLEVGNGIITNMRPETLAIITNRDVIAIDQDPLGIQGLRLKTDGDIQYWFKPLSGGDWAFCILNVGPEPAHVSIDWSSLEVNDGLSGRSTDFATVNYAVKDLWNASAKPFTTLVKGKGKLRKKLVQNPASAVVGSHDVVVYRLSPVASR